jgi:hypothetical protein
MSERVAMKIYIGGTLALDKLDDFAKLVGVDTGGPCLPDDIMDLREPRFDEEPDGPLYYAINELYGKGDEFDDIVKFCQLNKLPYDHYQEDGGTGLGNTVMRWRPAARGDSKVPSVEVCHYTDEYLSPRVMVVRDEIDAILDGHDAVTGSDPRVTLDKIREYLGKDVEPLPPFVVEDPASGQGRPSACQADSGDATVSGRMRQDV